MSLATYIGINFSLLTDEDAPDLYNEEFWVGSCFADQKCLDAVKAHQFSTSHVYEISSHWGIELYEGQRAKNREESLLKLNILLTLLHPHMAPGNYFELYSCWIGEEAESHEEEVTIDMHNLDTQSLEILEKTVVRFQY